MRAEDDPRPPLEQPLQRRQGSPDAGIVDNASSLERNIVIDPNEDTALLDLQVAYRSQPPRHRYTPASPRHSSWKQPIIM